MPKVKTVESLYSQCIHRIARSLENIKTPVNVKRFKSWTGSPGSVKQTFDNESSGINPFLEIRKLEPKSPRFLERIEFSLHSYM
jgi:hypothetical protein